MVRATEMAHEGFSHRWGLAGASLGAYWELTRGFAGAHQELSSTGRGLCLAQEAATTVDGLEWGDWVLSGAGRLCGACCSGTPVGLSVNAPTIELAMNLLETSFFFCWESVGGVCYDVRNH